MTNSGLAVQGLEVRRLATTLYRACLERKMTVEDAVEGDTRTGGLEARDRAFLTGLLLTAFRHKGEISAVLAKLLDKPLPRKSGSVPDILALGVAQLLFLDMPPHAVIDLAVRTAKADRNGLHFSGLVNAVLRKVTGAGRALLDGLDAPRLNTPDWLWARWSANHGAGWGRQIAIAHAERPSLDLSFKDEAAAWAESLGGLLLPNGQLRIAPGHPPVPDLPGFAEGAWWVQDAAATLPVRLLGDVRDKTVLDLCAAPGGKTLQLASGGARVTALDISGQRLDRLRSNLARTGLSAEVITGDVLSDAVSGTYDSVLLDAPCSATGTIRRHPELPYLKDERQIEELAGLQRRMLARAANFVAPGGLLVYCSCSLEPEEGEMQLAEFLNRRDDFEIVPAAPEGMPPEALCADGSVRTLPFMSFGPSRGMDGFFAVALRRRA